MASLSSTIHPLYGFHPIVTTSFHGITVEPSCSLYLLLTLPPLVFVDPYELANYKDSYTFRHAGPSNLELPVSAIGPSNSHVLMNVSRQAITKGAVQIPLHLRYGEVTVSMDEFQAVDISKPEGYVICGACIVSKPCPCPKLPSEGCTDSDAELHIPKEFTALFHQSNISRLSPSPSSKTVFCYQVPVGRAGDVSQVELGIAVTILLCFAYLVYTLYKSAIRLDDQKHPKSS
ncbi:PIG-X, partial [Desarmillaria tabescens]